jgi:uncharacterized protein YdeI (YjbR/CyaY-like superfamily)
MNPTFFKTPSDFRKWLDAHHTTHLELLVGFYKKGSGKPSITWPESVDQALCFGWIDGVRKRIDEVSYTIRFTPRKPRSIWSAINIKRVAELTSLGMMQPLGLKAFEARTENRSGIYAYEQRSDTLPEPYAKKLRQNKAAWDFYIDQAPWYRKVTAWWVVSAKKEETRLRRLDRLIEESARGVPLKEAARRKTPRSGQEH